jgi:hypothetical protein
VVAFTSGWNINCPHYLDEVSMAEPKKDGLCNRCDPITDRPGLYVFMDGCDERFGDSSASDTAAIP